MSLPTAYAEYALGTDDANINMKKVREVVSLRTTALRRMFEGKNDEMVIQNGKTIRTYLQTSDKATAHYFGIDGTETTSDPQVVTPSYIPWAKVRDDITWDDIAINLHEGDTAQMFFDLKQLYEQKCLISQILFMEKTGMWGVPIEAMESAADPTGNIRPMQSILSLVNEDGTSNSSIPDGYTTQSVQQVNPATVTGWRCQQKSYIDSVAATDPNHPLFKALSYMSRKCAFTSLPLGAGAYTNKSTMPAVVWMSLNGLTFLEDEMRRTQDTFVFGTRQDPSYPNPTIHGIPIDDIDYLDTAAVFSDAGTYKTEGAHTEAGPRALFMNLRDIHFVVHSDMFFHRHAPLTPHYNPTKHSIFVDTYCNIIAENRRSSGIVFPSATIAGF